MTQTDPMLNNKRFLESISDNNKAQQQIKQLKNDLKSLKNGLKIQEFKKLKNEIKSLNHDLRGMKKERLGYIESLNELIEDYKFLKSELNKRNEELSKINDIVGHVTIEEMMYELNQKRKALSKIIKDMKKHGADYLYSKNRIKSILKKHEIK